MLAAVLDGMEVHHVHVVNFRHADPQALLSSAVHSCEFQMANASTFSDVTQTLHLAHLLVSLR